jgi:hypothetical protein
VLAGDITDHFVLRCSSIKSNDSSSCFVQHMRLRQLCAVLAWLCT